MRSRSPLSLSLVGVIPFTIALMPATRSLALRESRRLRRSGGRSAGATLICASEPALRTPCDPGHHLDRVLRAPRLILARIQAHPAREHLHGPLAESLGLPTEVSLHSSDPPDPFAGYRACLSDIPADVTHLLVIQDDTVVCRNFAGAVDCISF